MRCQYDVEVDQIPQVVAIAKIDFNEGWRSYAITLGGNLSRLIIFAFHAADANANVELQSKLVKEIYLSKMVERTECLFVQRRLYIEIRIITF